MHRQFAARGVGAAGVILACTGGFWTATLGAQSTEPATQSPSRLGADKLQLARLPKVQLKAQPILTGSVKALANEAKRTNGEVRVPLVAANKLLPTSFRVVSGNGKVETAANDAQVVKLPARGTSVLTSTDAKKIAAESGLRVGVKTPLPWMVVDTKPKAEDPSDSVVRTARPYLALASAIRWNAESKLHIAHFQLGIDAEAGDDGKLEDPIVATLSVTCSEVEPRKVALDQIGPAGETVIQVGCDGASAKDPAKQELRVRVADAELAYNFPIPHQPGPPLLIADATSESGFGIGSVRLTVKNLEEDRTPLPAAQALTVQLQTDGASIEPSEVEIPAGASQATVEVRAQGVGTASIRAVGDRTSAAVEIDFTFPMVFLVTTLLGGATGGYLSAARARARSQAAHKKAKLAQAIGEGAIVGVLMVVALLVMPGIAGAIPSGVRSSVIGWLLMSALAGFVGIDLIERLANRVFGRTPNDSPKAPETGAKSDQGAALR